VGPPPPRSPEQLVRRSRTRCRRAHPRLLHPLRHRRLLPRRQAAPLLFTDAFTSTRGHQGEDRPSHSFVDAPAFEPRGNAVSATTPPRTLLVMLAFELGWENFIAGAAAVVAARAASLAFLPCFLLCVSRSGRCVAVVVSITAVAVAPACARTRSSACPCARALTHAHTRCGREDRAFGSACPFALSPPTRSPRRRTLCRTNCHGAHVRTG
jgi:hypothetical protein